MFGLGWEQIILILLAALFLLGPERIPGAVQWVMDSLRKVRDMASGAQTQMRSQLGPEIDELRRQVAELQSLKEIQELRKLRDLDPRRVVGKSLLGDQFSGGVSGLLGLNDANGNPIDPKGGLSGFLGLNDDEAAATAKQAADGATSIAETNGSAVNGAAVNGSGANGSAVNGDSLQSVGDDGMPEVQTDFYAGGGQASGGQAAEPAPAEPAPAEPAPAEPAPAVADSSAKWLDSDIT